MIVVQLSFPDRQKYLCFESNVDHYQVKFTNLRKVKEFLGKLQRNLEAQELKVSIDRSAIEEFEIKAK